MMVDEGRMATLSGLCQSLEIGTRRRKTVPSFDMGNAGIINDSADSINEGTEIKHFEDENE